MKKITKYKQSLKYLIYLVFPALLFSCSSEKEVKAPHEVETMNSGKLTVYCDQGLADLLEEPLEWYKTDYDKVKLTVETVPARFAMAKLLAGETRVAILARDYMKDEDSLMKEFKVEKHLRLHMADDALVFYTQKGFPLDTLNTDQILNILTDNNKKLTSYYPFLSSEPELVTSDYNSSEYANLFSMAAEGNQIHRSLRVFSDRDSVRDYVINNPNAIGIGFLSQVYADTSIKMLRIGYNDSTGKHIDAMKPVHQAWIVQGYYPYTVKLYVYLLEDIMNLPYWFGKFLAIEYKVQKYFLNKGLVPAYAKIRLIPED